MSSVALLTDSTWSLPRALADDLGVTVIPLHITSGDVSVPDLPESQVLRELLKGTATTSQPSTAEIWRAFEECTRQGARDIVAVHLSSRLSGTCEAVRKVGEKYGRETGVGIHVVDSLSIGAGIGFALAAARRAIDAGAEPAAVAAVAERVAHSSSVWFTVSDLLYLHRGGRLSASRAIVGSALGVRPILHITDGALGLAESVRGEARTRRRITELAIADALRLAASSGGVDIAVHHTGEAGAALLADSLRQAAADANVPVKDFIHGPVSGVLAAHGGPGSVAVVVAPHL